MFVTSTLSHRRPRWQGGAPFRGVRRVALTEAMVVAAGTFFAQTVLGESS